MSTAKPADEVRLVILDPGHFHAALIQKNSYPRVSPRVSVYARESPELRDYLNRISLFNTRSENPTGWELDVHTSPDFLERMLSERPGNVVVIAGRNRSKIDRILQSIQAGFHVLADKPWIIASADLPKLESALNLAESKGLAAYDIMTQRHEITSVLQKEFVNTPEVFGRLIEGTAERPAIKAKSIHHIMKTVAGVPIQRPVWFFNVDESGEALADVGTHMVDLAQWTAFPLQQLNYRTDVQMLDARRWPTVVTRAQFEQVARQPGFPAELSQWVNDGVLDYYANDFVRYTLRGVHVALHVLWNWEAPEGSGDVYEATFCGTKAYADIRQGRQQNYRPELYVAPNTPAIREEVFAALRKKVDALQKQWPGVAVDLQDGEAHIAVPGKYRLGHEAHFAQVTNEFFQYVANPQSLPAWEKGNMLTKYHISTRGGELAVGR